MHTLHTYMHTFKHTYIHTWLALRLTFFCPLRENHVFPSSGDYFCKRRVWHCKPELEPEQPIWLEHALLVDAAQRGGRAYFFISVASPVMQVLDGQRYDLQKPGCWFVLNEPMNEHQMWIALMESFGFGAGVLQLSRASSRPINFRPGVERAIALTSQPLLASPGTAPKKWNGLKL